MATYGRKRSTDTGFGSIAVGKKRGSVFGTMPGNGWIYAVGFLGGKAPGDPNPVVRAAVHKWTGSAPGDRVIYTDTVSVAAVMTNGTEGQQYELGWTITADTPRAVKALSGERYVIDLLPGTAALGHGMVPAATSPESNKNFYENSDTNIPDDPFGSATASFQGTMTVWFVYDPNEAPAKPINRTPSGTINTLTPVFEGDFDDPNAGDGGTNRGDEMKQFDLELRQVGNSSLKWNQAYNAGSTQKAAKRFSKGYEGSALLVGTSYEWRCRVSDDFGLFGDWSDWLQFTVSGIGTVTLNGTPTGYQTAFPTGYQGRWQHDAGLSTNAVQIKILTAGGSLVVESGIITKTVNSSAAPGTLFTITSPGDTAVSDYLEWDSSYKYQIRGRDTNNNWSDYSDPRTFEMDYAPSVPTVISPKQYKIITTLEPLIVTASDPDPEDPTSSLVVKARIRDTQPILTNPSADANTAGWANDANGGSTAGITYALSRDTVVFDSTPGAFKVNVSASTAAAGSFVNQVLSDLVPCEAGESYGVTHKTRVDNVNINVKQYIRWFDASQVYLSASVEPDWTPTINTWQSRTFAAIAPANAKYMRHGIQAKMQTANLTGNFWWDTIDVSSAIRRIRTIPWVSARSRFEYTPVPEDVPHYGIYEWNSYSFDGVLYSGATTVEAEASRSASGSFTYALGPTVTITAPTDLSTVTASTLNVTWTATGQVKRRVWLTLAGEADVVPGADTGLEVTASQAFTIPAGWYHNGISYDVHVQVENATPLSGYADVTFTVTYTPPASPTNVQVVPVKVDDFDPVETGISISFDPSVDAGFQQYIIYRRADSGPDAAQIILARIDDVTAIVLIDPNPASGHQYTYGVSQIVDFGGDLLESTIAEGSASVTLAGVVLTDVADGVNFRIALWKARRSFPRVVSEQTYENLAGTAPTTVRNATYYRTPQIDAMLLNDEYSNADDKRTRLEALDARHPTVCYRDDKGRKDFDKMESCDIVDELPDWFTATIRLRGEYYVEGEP